MGKSLSLSGLRLLVCKVGTLVVGPAGSPCGGGRAQGAQPARSLSPPGRYSGRSDAGCLYELTVKLLSEHEDVLAEFSSGQVAVPQDSDDGGWIEVSSEAPGRRGAGPGCDGRGLRKPCATGGAGCQEAWRRDPGLRNRGCLEAGQCARVGGLGRTWGPEPDALPSPPRSPTPSPTTGPAFASSASSTAARTPSTGRAGSGPV